MMIDEILKFYELWNDKNFIKFNFDKIAIW